MTFLYITQTRIFDKIEVAKESMPNYNIRGWGYILVVESMTMNVIGKYRFSANIRNMWEPIEGFEKMSTSDFLHKVGEAKITQADPMPIDVPEDVENEGKKFYFGTAQDADLQQGPANMVIDPEEFQTVTKNNTEEPTELKTLKDIECEVMAENGFSDVVCTSKELKQEAIKWIKEIDNIQDNIYERTFDEIGLDICDHVCCPSSIIQWIETFFNIEEKDLE